MDDLEDAFEEVALVLGVLAIVIAVIEVRT